MYVITINYSKKKIIVGMDHFDAMIPDFQVIMNTVVPILQEKWNKDATDGILAVHMLYRDGFPIEKVGDHFFVTHGFTVHFQKLRAWRDEIDREELAMMKLQDDIKQREKGREEWGY